MVPRENKNTPYAKFEGTNKEYHGIFRSGLWSLSVTVVLFRVYVVFCYLLCAFLLGLRVIKSHKMLAVLVTKRGVMVPGVSCVDGGNWGRELVLWECSVLKRILFWQESRLIRWCHIQRCRAFSERIGPRIILLESQPGKQSSCSKRSREITTEPIAAWVQTTKTLTKQK